MGIRASRLRQHLTGRRTAVITVMAVLLLFGGVHAQAGSSSVTGAREAQASVGAIAPTIDCSALAQGTHVQQPSGSAVPDFGNLPGAPTAIDSAAIVPASAQMGEYCDVKGTISPQIQFDLKLPTKTWQGRYMQMGCGGSCGGVGSPQSPACDLQPGGDFAVSATNDGHVGHSGDDMWALDSAQLRNDFAYRAVHLLSVVSKAIIHAYYGASPQHSYFQGCSDGGREALVEAQRYPDDFDGIVAGDPALLWNDLVGEDLPWNIVANDDRNGNPILTADKLPALHAAVISACAGQSGTNDGIIQDPRQCHFDPASLLCPGATDSANCLTAAQIAVVKRLYQGPVDKNGRHLSPGGLPYGSELGWQGLVISPAGTPSGLDRLASTQLRYMMFKVGQQGPATPLDWSFTDAGYQQLVTTYNATNPDLSAFRAHGGKLIIYHGTADPLIPPWSSIEYYAALRNHMGGLPATQQFARLYMISTLYHCSGGYGPDQFSMVNPIVHWVEQGVAPDGIVTSQTDTSGNVTRTWPVFPYPEVTTYKGSGDVNSSTSYTGVLPSPLPSDEFDWIDNSIFGGHH